MFYFHRAHIYSNLDDGCFFIRFGCDGYMIFRL